MQDIVNSVTKKVKTKSVIAVQVITFYGITPMVVLVVLIMNIMTPTHKNVNSVMEIVLLVSKELVQTNVQVVMPE